MKGHIVSLWDKFFVLSLGLLKENGSLCFITPGLWRAPTSEILSKVKDMDLVYLETHHRDDGFKVFKARTPYDWYIIRNRKYSGSTVIKDHNGFTNRIDISSLPFIPNSDYCRVFSLFAKDGEERCEILYDLNYHTGRDWMSSVKTDVFKYPCINNVPKNKDLKIFYSKDNKGHFCVKKVVVPISICSDFYVDYKGEYGLTHWVFGIKIKNKNEGEMIRTALKSKEFEKVWKAISWTNREYTVFSYFRKNFWEEFI